MRHLCRLMATSLALTVVAVPAFAQGGFEDKWYWGGQATTLFFKSRNADGSGTGIDVAAGAGGHWLITKQRVALYVAFDQLFFTGSETSAIIDNASTTGLSTAQFSRAQRIQASVYAFPLGGFFQPYGGLGVMIGRVTNLTAATATAQADDAATRPALVVTGGVQWRLSGFAVFGSYQYSPGDTRAVFKGEQHVLSGGLRFALTGASEAVSTR